MIRDVVVIGGSAGSLKALRDMVAYLPADLPAAVLVATHLAPNMPSRVAESVAKAGSLPAVEAVDGERMAPGRMYTAAPDRHLLLDGDGWLRLSRGPRQNRSRPAVDALFRSAARWCGPRVIGVVLSGSLDDGAAGLAAIVQCGGVGLVQDPLEATFSGMPEAAAAAVPGAEALPVAQLARRITELAGQPVRPAVFEPSTALIWETDMIRTGRSSAGDIARPAGLGCPDCGGGLTVLTTGEAVRYICHAGHSYSPEIFLAARDDTIETAAWTVFSAIREKTAVLEELAERAARSGDDEGSRRYGSAARQAIHAGELVHDQLLSDEPLSRHH